MEVTQSFQGKWLSKKLARVVQESMINIIIDIVACLLVRIK